MVERKYKFYSDDSHGWLAVPKKDIDKLDVGSEISTYSYMSGKTAYLEEDSDAQILIGAAEEEGWYVEIKDVRHDGQSRIRNFAPYKQENSHDIWATGTDAH